ncbi:hypothetical protein [Marinomonas shanghaiensis]|uniref:hypothetical protein n=1 Tax=Marinomonas shanghaiensis TaxID=2202418 RepID=UPI000DBA66C4|nr:hypothetical protein [Marinomonas shanghaiensis]
MDILNTQYTEEQLELVSDELKKCEERERESDGWVQYPRSDAIRQRGNQVFAVFGGIAHDISALKPEEIHMDSNGDIVDHYECLPVIVNGQAVRQEPEEGSSGTMYLMRAHYSNGIKQSGEWRVSFLTTGWLRVSELDWTAKEISEQIESEIWAGENHITGSRDLG